MEVRFQRVEAVSSRIESDAPPASAAVRTGREAEIPYAIRWLVPKGERFANFDILNDNDTQLDYYRRFGHIYAVGIPTKKWRLVVVSDPELLDEVAANEEQFGKRDRGDQLLRPAAELARRRHLRHRRRRALRADPPRDAAVVLAAAPADAARAHEGAGAEDRRRRGPRCPTTSRSTRARGWSATRWRSPGAARATTTSACSTATRMPHPFAEAVPESTKESILRVAEPRPDFTLFAGPRATRAKEALPAAEQGAVRDRRRTRARAHAHVPARAADGSAQPSRRERRTRRPASSSTPKRSATRSSCTSRTASTARRSRRHGWRTCSRRIPTSRRS